MSDALPNGSESLLGGERVQFEKANFITLNQAASEIKQACVGPGGQHVRSPFFFVVGSGISVPSVPLAAAVQIDCEVKAKSLGRANGPPSNDPNVAYSHWFRAAFPHRFQRQQYLKGLIDNKAITHANFRLAHLLIDRSLSNIVVTTNFDDLLSRALALFGEQHIVCDDPRTVERIDPESSQIQLIHVHGSHWFYDCRNTSAEIEERAKPSPDTTQTMAALLDKILAYRAPIVCGYSGWENDVFMTALKRRLLAPLPHNMYWFCFRHREHVGLPKFLNHADVYFVSPPEGRSAGPSAAPAGSDTGEDNATLSATTVLDTLIRTIGAKTPRLINNPLLFYADQLRSAVPDEDAGEGGDIYAFRSVLERVERAKKRDEDEVANAQNNDSELEAIREAVRGARYDEVFSHVDSISEPSRSQLRELLSILEKVAYATVDSSPETAVRSCDAFFSHFARLEEQSVATDMSFIIVSIVKGNERYAQKDWAGAIDAYKAAIARFGDGSDQEILRGVGVAWNNTGLALRHLGRLDDAVAVHDTMIHRLRSFDGLADSVVAGLALKAVTLLKQKKLEEATQTVDEAKRLAADAMTLSSYASGNLAAAVEELAAAPAIRDADAALKVTEGALQEAQDTTSSSPPITEHKGPNGVSKGESESGPAEV